MRPVPATTALPLIAASPASFTTGSASPVSNDSSISRFSWVRITPSATTCAPVRNSTMSSSTNSCVCSSTTLPSRTTCARGALTTRSWSSTFLARSSWTTPITLLATMTPANNASFGDPAAITSAARIATMKLIGANTLPRTIWPTVRVGAFGTTLVRPLPTRSATSTLVRPVAGSVWVSVTQ